MAHDLPAGCKFDLRAPLKWHASLPADPFAYRRRCHIEFPGEGCRTPDDVAGARDGFDRFGVLFRGHGGADSKALPNTCQQAFPHAPCAAHIQAMPIVAIPKLGEKLREAMRLRGVTQADVARAFGVKPPTVSKDWLRYGRIAKRHFPRLVEYFELPYEWWFGQPHPGANLLFDARRENFRTIVAETYNSKRVTAAKAFGLPNVAAVVAHENNAPIESDLARRVESAAEKPAGWLDVPHRTGQPEMKRPLTVDQRLAALPDALRTYIIGELELCEAVQDALPADLLKAPSAETRTAFQTYLESLDRRRRRSA